MMSVQLRQLNFIHRTRRIDNEIILGPSVMSPIRWYDLEDEKKYQEFMLEFVKKMYTRFNKQFEETSHNGVPLSYLLLSDKREEPLNSYINRLLKKTDKDENNIKDLHIQWGYTFKDARGTGYSTLLRKLIQVYAYDKNIDFVSTHAVAWGSQKGSKSAGMFQMPIRRKRQAIYSKLSPDLQKRMFQPNQNTFRSLRNAALRKAVFDETRYTPQKQQNALQRHYGGRIPLSVYGNGNTLNILVPGNGTIYGTHMRKVKAGKM